MKSKIMLFVLTVFTTFVLAAPSKVAGINIYDRCQNAFTHGKYEKAFKACTKIQFKNNKVEFMLLASSFFLKVPKERLNYILYHGMYIDPIFYRHRYNKGLYTAIEKHHLQSYFAKFSAFADKGIPQAQFLTAKIFYINEIIIKSEEIQTSNTADEILKGKKQYYNPNLEKFLAFWPDNTEALYLLGKEGLQLQYPQQAKFDKQYYSVINTIYFEKLQKAADLGHVVAEELLAAVENWDKHIKGLEKKANLSDLDALFELGFIQLKKSKSNNNNESLEKAIKNFTTAGNLGHADSLQQLFSIYWWTKPNKQQYYNTLKKLDKINDHKGILMLGDYYLCEENKELALTMYAKSQMLGNYLAEYAIRNLKAGDMPSDGCME